MRPSRFLAPLVVSLFATACLEPFALSSTQVGVITLRTHLDDTTPVLRGSASFYEVAGLQLSFVEPTACAPFAYVADVPEDDFGSLNAGDSLSFTVQGLSESATRRQAGSLIRYAMRDLDFLSFASGDTLTLTVPGEADGFVATSAKIRLAESFIADTIPDQVNGLPLELSWTPATATGSFMIVSLRYATAPSMSAPNTEIFCIFDDDGTGSIPASYAQAWASSNVATQEYAFTRAREALVVVDSKRRLMLRSLYSLPTPPLSAPPT